MQRARVRNCLNYCTMTLNDPVRVIPDEVAVTFTV